MSETLRVAIVGVGGMGQGHGRNMAALSDLYKVVAAVDVDEAKVRQYLSAFDGAKAYTDYDAMLRDATPDVVVLATGPVPRAQMTIAATESGVRGIYAEKPMAVGFGEAKAMVEACRQRGAALAINHQRRMSHVFRTMKRVIDEGLIGRVETIRGSHAGDILGDGTHTVDLIRCLAGDAECKWVLGQIHRDPPTPDEPPGQGFQVSGGYRYGHAVENGGIAVMQFQGGVRGELFSGEMKSSPYYQDIQVIGSQGRLWRAGDQATIPLLVHDTSGGWRQVPLDDAHTDAASHGGLMRSVFRQFHAMVTQGAPHPLSGESALQTHEVLMAIYESARLGRRIDLPLQQDVFPLQLMTDAGTPSGAGDADADSA